MKNIELLKDMIWRLPPRKRVALLAVSCFVLAWLISKIF